MNSNPSSHIFFDTIKMNSSINRAASGKNSEDVSESEIKNGFLGFTSESLYGCTAKNSFCLNDLNDNRKNNPFANKNLPVENVFSDILKCSQFSRTDKKEYSTDAVNLDELNLSVSKILNSTKNGTGGAKVENESVTSDVNLKVPATEGDHTYHLPLPNIQNGDSAKIAERTIDSNIKGMCAAKTCHADEKFSLTSSIDICSSAFSKDSSVASQSVNVNLTNTENICNQNVGSLKKKETDSVVSVDKTAAIKDSQKINISSTQTDETSSSEIKMKTKEEERKLKATADDKESPILKRKSNFVFKGDNCGEQNETPNIVTEKTSVENSDLRTETTLPKKSGFPESQSFAGSPNEREEAKEEDGIKGDLSADPKVGKVETQSLSLNDSPLAAETSYDCNECGAKMKTQNSLFIHKKMHLSGAIVTSISAATKRKATEENEAPKEVKRKRGRPKLIRTDNSSDKVTPLKENVVKKVLKKDVPSDEVKQPKSKKIAKEVKENKISNDNKAAKRERISRLRPPAPMKIIPNKPKRTCQSEKLNGDCKNSAKAEGRPKGKSKSYYSSAVPNNLLRKFACPECGAKFKRNDHLKRHQLLHSEKTFQCRDCEMKFYRGDKLKLHTLRHHAKVAQKLTSKLTPKTIAEVKVVKLPKKSVECQKCGIQFLRVVPPKTDKSGQTRRKNSCCISCGAKMNDENN